MDDSVKRYRERRQARLDSKRVVNFDSIKAYRERQFNRVLTRLDSAIREDAGVGWAYGLAESKGIDTKGMSPKEVFEALKEKGVKTPGPSNGGPKGKNMKGEGDKGKAFINAAKASHDHKIGGYERKNIKNFKNGYGETKVDAKDRECESGVTMKANTNEKGEWTAEREGLHSKIIDDTFAGVKKATGKPTTTFMGGGPSSGKTYVVNQEAENLNLPKDDERILVDPDKCKHPLPEYDPDNPGPVHEESSALAKRITKLAQENGYNTLVDGTGDGSVDKMRKKIQQAREAGNTVNGVYVFKPVEDAICSNFARERTVNPKEVVKTHKAISSILPEIAADFDNVKLYANLRKGEPPVLIAEGGGGKGLKILNEDIYKQFLANGSYEYNQERIDYLKGLPESQKKNNNKKNK